MCLSRAYVKELRAILVGGQSISSRVIFTLAAFLVLFLPYFVEARPYPTQMSAHVIAAVGQSRLLLAVFCIALYLPLLGLTFWVLFEATNLVRAVVATNRA